MAALETWSFRDLLRGLELKYEQARSPNGEIKKASWDLSAPDLKHQHQIIWQDWEINRGDAQQSMTDPFYFAPKPNMESISSVNVSKPSPASPWQKSEFQLNGHAPKQPLKKQKKSPSRMGDGCRVSSPVAALASPPQETVEIGLDDRESPRIGSFIDTSRPSSSSLPTSVNFAANDLELEREKEEKRIRRQFKRLTKSETKRGEVRRLFPWQLHSVIAQFKAQGKLSSFEIPTLEQVTQAMRDFTALYSTERRTRLLSRQSASSSLGRASNTALGDVCLDLPSFFDFLTKENGYNFSAETTSVIKCLRSACVLESKVAIDDDMSLDSESGINNNALQLNDNRLDTLSAVIILLNAVVIGISTDNDAEGIQWEVLEVLFTIYFVGEMCYKLRMLGCKIYFIGPDWHWNSFDAVVVFIAIFDLGFTHIVRLTSGPDGGDNANLGSFTIIKMARLGRLARLVRILRFKLFHELKLMIQGVIAGLRVLFWAVVLLFFFIYLLGIVLRKTMGESEIHPYAVRDSFESVPRSMLTLFRCFTDGCVAYDGTPLQVHLFNYYGAWFMFAYMLTFLFVTMGIFNLIMAIFIDNVMDASLHRKQQERGANAATMEVSLKELIANLVSKSHKRRKSDFMTTARASLSAAEARVTNILDLDNPATSLIARRENVDRDLAAMDAENVTIDRETFESWLVEPDFLTMLDDLDIGTSNKSELFDVLDCDLSGELEVSEVISGLMKLRGPSDKSDAVAALLGIRYMTARVDEVVRVICEERMPPRQEPMPMPSDPGYLIIPQTPLGER